MEYNDNLNPEEQVSTEELIARIIFDHEYADGIRPVEVDCQLLSQKILLSVLETFRPDLLADYTEDEETPVPDRSYQCIHCKTILNFPADEFTPDEMTFQLQEHIADELEANCRGSGSVFANFISVPYSNGPIL